MNDTVEIKVPTSFAVRFAAKGIAVVVIGVLFGLYMRTSSDADYDHLQGASPEQRQLEFERYERELKRNAERTASAAIVFSIVSMLFFFGFYEFLSAMFVVATGKFLRADNADSDYDTGGWSVPPERDDSD